MKVGDLVRVIQSKIDDLRPSYLGRMGVIVEAMPLEYSDNDWYRVAIGGGFMKFRYDYLEVVGASEKGNDCQATSRL